MNHADAPAKSSRRLITILVIALPLFAILGAASWWLQAKFPSADATAARAQAALPVFAKYRPADQPPSVILESPDVTDVLDRLAADCGDDIVADVDRTEARLRSADAHLDRALADPATTPFVGPDAFTYSDLLLGCKPMSNAMINELSADPSVSNRVSPLTIEALDRILFATIARTQYDPNDLIALEKARAAGFNDPLLLACLIRNLPGNHESYNDVAQALFVHRKDREMSPPSAAFVYHSMRLVKNSLAPIEFAETVSEYIPIATDVWQWVATTKPAFPVKSFLFTETYNFSKDFNLNAVGDLLIALDKCQNPAVSPELLHLLASHLHTEIASAYRGWKWISETDSNDLEKFGDYAQRAANHLLKAWTIEPRHNFLPAQLGKMENWAGTTPRSEDAWFRHSLAVSVDNKVAWSGHLGSLETKWGGSPEQQLWFAEMCVGGERMVGRIFFQYADALQIRINEAGFTERLGQDLRIRRLAKTVVDRLQAYSMTDPHPDAQRRSLPPIVATLWQAGDFDDLDWLLSVYGNWVECSAMHPYRAHIEEIRQFSAQVVQSKNMGCWFDIHNAMHRTHGPIDNARLDRLDLAIEEARDEVTDNPELSKSLAGYQRRSRQMRMLNDGKEVVLTETDLRECFEIGYYATYNYGTTNPSAIDEAVVDESNEALANESTGFVEFQISASIMEARLLIPLAVDPPLQLSADVEFIPQATGPTGDPYGASLLIGASSGGAYATNKRGPILTALPEHQGFLQDELPVVMWEQGKGNYRAQQRTEPFVRCHLRIDAFPDGYRTFVDGKQFTEMKVPLETDHLVQIGRYSNAGYANVSNGAAHYRISNVRLRKLAETSVDIQSN